MTEEGLFLAFRPPVTPAASQFLDRMEGFRGPSVLAVPRGERRSGGVYTKTAGNSTP